MFTIIFSGSKPFTVDTFSVQERGHLNIFIRRIHFVLKVCCFGIILYVACLRNTALQFEVCRLGNWHAEHLHKHELFTFPDLQRGKSHFLRSAGMKVDSIKMSYATMSVRLLSRYTPFELSLAELYTATWNKERSLL
jgi:hypothetical protein